MEEEKKTNVGVTVNTPPVNAKAKEDSDRKAKFEKARKKILVVHDELFRRLAQ